MPLVIDVVLNPAAGRRSRRVRHTIERELRARGAELRVHETTARGHAREIARMLAAGGAGRILAAGGDGTIHEVANGMLDGTSAGAQPPALGVVPVGSGNDFAKLLGPRDGARVYERATADHVRWFDVGVAEWSGGREHFVNGMGTGVDVEVVRFRERAPHVPGLAGYLLAVVRALAAFRARPLRVRIDGRETSWPTLILAVGNGTCQAGGFRFWPRARPDDGRLDACIVEQLGALRIAAAIPRLLRATHEGKPGIHTSQAEVIEIDAPESEPLPFQLDGELREAAAGSTLRVSVRPRALRVLADPEPAP